MLHNFSTDEQLDPVVRHDQGEGQWSWYHGRWWQWRSGTWWTEWHEFDNLGAWTYTYWLTWPQWMSYRPYADFFPEATR